MPTLLFLLTTACLAGSSAFVAAALRLRGAVAFLLAAYLVAWAEVVVLLAVLSSVHLVVRSVVAPATVALLVAGVIVWRLAGRPPPPSARGTVAQLREALRDRALLLLAAIVALGFAYLTALALFTPANSWDAMWVWLARAAFWKQQHGVGYVDDVVVLNAYPPVASMADLYSMVVAAGDRFVTLGALAAYAATTLAVLGIARRIGLDRRRALFGGLVFATLPVVVLQASGALIDLPVASFLAACVYFGLGQRRAEVGLAGSAFALAVGAKLTALLAAPVALLVLAAARPRRLRLRAAVALAAALAGSGWYFVNLAKTGSAGGGLREHLEREGYLAGTDHAPAAAAARALRLTLNFAEVPGAAGWWWVSYAFAALAAALLVRVELRRSRLAALAAAAAVSPLVVLVLEPVLHRGYRFVFFHAGRPDLGLLDDDRRITGASALGSYYGPVGLFLLLAAAAALVLVARRRLSARTGALAAAPLLFVVIVALALSYSSFWGRLFVFPVALAAAGAGVLLRVRPLAWGVVALAAATLVLTLRANDEKPPAAWGKPRWWVQTRVGPGRDNGERELIRFAEQSIPPRAHVGLTIADRDWSYPFFGRRLERTVRFVRSTTAVPDDLKWLVVAPARPQPGPAWRRVRRTADGWAVFVRR